MANHRARFVSLFRCQGVNLQDTDDLYARFTTTVLCNSLVQNAVKDCELSTEQAEPLCAETCAEFARSEAFITSDNELCNDPADDLMELIRADFTNCALPDAALSASTCISGIDNERENCGYSNSTLGFCSYCAAGGINSTDTCCYNAKAEDVCKDVKLPNIAPQTMTFEAPTPTATNGPSRSGSSDSDSDADEKEDEDDDSGLSGGAIAGIVIGSIAGVALLALLLFFCLRRRRRSGGSTKGSIFNQPSPARKGASMSMTQSAPQGYEVLPGGRIARMSALEGHSGDSPSRDRHSSSLAAGAMGAGAGYMAGRRKNDSSSSDFGDSPASDTRGGVLRAPPTAFKRDGSLSSSSVLGSSVPQSPTSAGFSSPQGVASQQSEQLPFFKDYYSTDDIHPGDRVAVLWAYQPRAADEFTLDRADMLKVVGIWDDGWATGILLDERAEEWEARRRTQRDSGVSNTSGRRDSSPAASGEIKAFPLVCVCLPEHWRKTIEGDGSTESGSNGQTGPVIP